LSRTADDLNADVQTTNRDGDRFRLDVRSVVVVDIQTRHQPLDVEGFSNGLRGPYERPVIPRCQQATRITKRIHAEGIPPTRSRLLLPVSTLPKPWAWTEKRNHDAIVEPIGPPTMKRSRQESTIETDDRRTP